MSTAPAVFPGYTVDTLDNRIVNPALTQDESIPNDLHDMRIELTAEMDDGATHHVVCKGPKGTWGMAPLTDDDHAVKLRDCFNRAMPSAQVEKLLASLNRIEKLSADGVRDIVKSIARSQQVVRPAKKRAVARNKK